MSKRLEDFIKTNKEEFDDLEPSADLWLRIEKHLPAEGTEIKKREAKTFSLSFVLKVAASVIIVMGISFGLYVGKTPQRASDVVGFRLPKGASRADYAAKVAELRAQGQPGAALP